MDVLGEDIMRALEISMIWGTAFTIILEFQLGVVRVLEEEKF